MADFICENSGGNECQAHRYVMSLIAQLKEEKDKMEADQKKLIENGIRLTENLEEIKRYCERSDRMFEEMKTYNKLQDDVTKVNSTFVTKAVAVIGAISFIAALSPMVFWVISKIGGR